jgi:hypothetical protein
MTVIAVVTTEPADQRVRARSITTTPPIAPMPNAPSSNPYVVDAPVARLAIVGKSANVALAQNIAVAERTMTAWIDGA